MSVNNWRGFFDIMAYVGDDGVRVFHDSAGDSNNLSGFRNDNVSVIASSIW